jgi:predicted nucleotidyltransferase
MRSLMKDRPLDPASLDILRAVSSSAQALDVPVMLVGATARDIMLTFLHGIPSRRATEDMDFALAVPTWEAFDNVTGALTRDARFVMGKAKTNRIHFHYSQGAPPRNVDVIPYGAGVGGDIFRWAKNDHFEMSVTGYEDAAKAAESLGFATNLSFNVVTIPGLTLLKFFAWLDRRTATSRDAFDLALMLHTYSEAGNHDRLFGEEIKTLEMVEFDLGQASPRLLGRDVAHLCSAPTFERLDLLLSDAPLMSALALDMVRARGIDRPDAAEALLHQFRAGFRS